MKTRCPNRVRRWGRGLSINGESAGARTQDPILKRDVLYQLSYALTQLVLNLRNILLFRRQSLIYLFHMGISCRLNILLQFMRLILGNFLVLLCLLGLLGFFP